MVETQTRTLATTIERILLADEIIRRDTVAFESYSTPGHLLHLVESGLVQQQAGGQPEQLRPGSMVWYHQCEPVKGRILRAPWRFITIGFLAPSLPPPSEERRVFRATPRAARCMRALLRAWRDESRTPLQQALLCHALLYEILTEILPLTTGGALKGLAANKLIARWWLVEKQLRDQLDRPMRLKEMAKLAGLSARSAVRACRMATGMPPARRHKTLRLQHARNLLQLTDLPVTEIAWMTGYPRVQELSRDIRAFFGQTARAVRAQQITQWKGKRA